MKVLTGGSIVMPGTLLPLLYRLAEPADSELSRRRAATRGVCAIGGSGAVSVSVLEEPEVPESVDEVEFVGVIELIFGRV